MPQKYSKVQFKKDLSDLTKLINQFKQDGGKKKAKRSAVKKDVKRYTIVEVDGKKIASGEGSYTGNGHAQAARKACGRACKKRNKANLNFSLRETTQGSDKAVKKARINGRCSPCFNPFIRCYVLTQQRQLLLRKRWQ